MGYSHYDVAHRFATGLGSDCSGSRMFFSGDKIYSYGYHFIIAQKYRGKLLWNDQTYSVSTSKHQSIVQSACSHYDFIHCSVLEGYPKQGDSYFAKENFEKWLKDINYIAENRLAKARKPEKYLAEIYSICDKAERFAKFFEVDLPKEFKIWSETTDKGDVVERLKKEAQRKQREQKRRYKEQIEKFLNGEARTCVSDYQLLRYNAEKDRVETSMAVDIPAAIAKRFWESLKDGSAKVGDKVLYYTVNHLNGDVHVGCHKFKKQYLIDFGQTIFGNAS